MWINSFIRPPIHLPAHSFILPFIFPPTHPSNPCIHPIPFNKGQQDGSAVKGGCHQTKFNP